MWLSVGGCKSMEERAREQMSKGNNSSSWRSKSFGENEREREREWERDGSIGPLGHKPKWDNAFLPSFIPYSIFYQTRNRNLQVSVSVKFRRHRRRRRLERKSFACLLRSSEQKLLRAKFVLIFFLLCASRRRRRRRRRLLWIIPHSFISQRNKSGKASASVTGRYFFLSRQKLSSG